MNSPDAERKVDAFMFQGIGGRAVWFAPGIQLLKGP